VWERINCGTLWELLGTEKLKIFPLSVIESRPEVACASLGKFGKAISCLELGVPSIHLVENSDTGVHVVGGPTEIKKKNRK